MQQKAKPVISDFGYQSKPKKVFHMLLPQLIVGVVLVVLIIVAVIIIDIHQSNEPRTGVCSASLINESLSNATSNNLKSLAENVSSIKALSNYKHDPNCMYIVTLYYIDTLNTMQAQSSLKLFNSAYNGRNLSPILLKYENAKALSFFVDNLTKTTEQQQKNFSNLQGHGLNQSQ